MAGELFLRERLVELAPDVAAGRATVPPDLRELMAARPALASEFEALCRVAQAVVQAGASSALPLPPAGARARVADLLRDPDLLLAVRAASEWRHRPRPTDEDLLALAEGRASPPLRRAIERWTGSGPITCLETVRRLQTAIFAAQHEQREAKAAASAHTRPSTKRVSVDCEHGWRIAVEDHGSLENHVFATAFGPSSPDDQPPPRLLIGIHPAVARELGWPDAGKIVPLRRGATPEGPALVAIVPGISAEQVAFVGLLSRDL